MPLENWPPGDRAAWEQANIRINSPFRKNGGGRVPSSYTIRARLRGFGRWLGFLRDNNYLKADAARATPATPELVDLFIDDLRQHGNCDQTVLSRICGLHGALRMLEPGGDHKWLICPQGVPIKQYLDIQRKERVVIHSATLLELAERLFQAGLAHPKPRSRRALIRDAAIVGILVMPAPRLGALGQLRVGRNLQRRHDGWCLDQDAGITKMSKDEWCPLHHTMTPILDRYLAVDRHELLGGRVSDRMWIAQGGADLAEATISRRVRLLTGRAFGHDYGPHAFRRSIGTTAATDGYLAPDDGRIILNHTNDGTTNRYYNLATGAAAAARHSERLKRMRAAAERESRSNSGNQTIGWDNTRLR
jgi:integrase